MGAEAPVADADGVFGAIFGVWNVFQSPGVDFRLIALGAMLPLAIDAPFRSHIGQMGLWPLVEGWRIAPTFRSGACR